AVIVDEAFPAAAILEEIRSLADPRIESVRLFDCYHGTPVPPGKKSLAYSIAYRAPDRTLTDEEVSGVHAGVLQRLRERFRLELGQKVKISGVGNFVVNEKRPRKGRNPQTGEEIVISGRRVLTFKASQVLKKTMNGGGPPPATGGAT